MWFGRPAFVKADVFNLIICILVGVVICPSSWACTLQGEGRSTGIGLKLSIPYSRNHIPQTLTVLLGQVHDSTCEGPTKPRNLAHPEKSAYCHVVSGAASLPLLQLFPGDGTGEGGGREGGEDDND